MHAVGGQGRSAAAGAPQVVQLAGQVGINALVPFLPEQPADFACKLPAEPALFFSERQPPDLPLITRVTNGHKAALCVVAGIKVLLYICSSFRLNGVLSVNCKREREKTVVRRGSSCAKPAPECRVSGMEAPEIVKDYSDAIGRRQPGGAGYRLNGGKNPTLPC